MEERRKYFDEALSDFTHDVASGAAIRHLTDLGYSVEQICQALSYPTPRERVRRTVYRYMLESGLLLERLPEEVERFHVRLLPGRDREEAYRYLHEKIQENGEESSYFACPFGLADEKGAGRADTGGVCAGLSCLNKREREYIEGIPWENRLLYHRLNGRMREIAGKLIWQTELGCGYYFLKTKETVKAAE